MCREEYKNIKFVTKSKEMEPVWRNIAEANYPQSRAHMVSKFEIA